MSGAGRDMALLEIVPENASVDDVFEAIKNQERRELLVALNQIATAERIPALARNLALDSDGDAGRIYLRLYHCHVPKLEALGIISYDSDQEMVELTTVGEQIAESLDEE